MKSNSNKKPAIPFAESIGTGVAGNGRGRKLPMTMYRARSFGAQETAVRQSLAASINAVRVARLDDTPNHKRTRYKHCQTDTDFFKGGGGGSSQNGVQS